MAESLRPNATRGSVKGNVLLSRVSLLRSRGGESGLTRVLSRLTPEDRAIFTGTISPMAWYPFEISERLDLAIGTDLGGGDAVFRALGARSAEDNLEATHGNYVRTKDPQGLLKQAAQIYKLYYNTGYRTYEWVATNRAVIRTFEAKSFSRNDCLTIVGWHEKAIELCGGQAPRVTEPKCRVRGDDRCEYVCEWR